MTPGTEHQPRHEEATLAIEIHDALAIADLEDCLAEVLLPVTGSWMDRRLCHQPERVADVDKALEYLTARGRIARHTIFSNLLRVVDAPAAAGAPE